MTDNDNRPGPGPGAAGAHDAPPTPANPRPAAHHATPAPGDLPPRGEPRHIPVPRSLYPTIVAVFCGVLIISNITATKGVQIGPAVTDGAFFLFPLSYILGDVLSECYGFRATRRAIWTGFGVLALGLLSFWIAIQLPPADFYANQEAFATVLGTVPQLVLAGLAGYAVGQLLNAWSLVAIKRRTGERTLWARLIGSTVVGELADTVIFCAIAASAIGIVEWTDFANFVIVGFLWKAGVEVVCLPLTYAAIGWVKRHDGYWGRRETVGA
ncbi:queuosine precursor transporter [Corynebacterium sp. 335C]